MSKATRRARWAWLLVGVGVCAFAAEPRKMELLGQFIRSSQVVYPLVVGDWHAGEEQRYDSAALGASIRYRGGIAGWSDIYVYPAGLLDDAALEKVAREEVAQIQAASGQAGTWTAVQVQPVQRMELQGAADEDGKRKPEVVWGAVMQVRAKDRDFHSVLLLALRDMYFVKLRYSVPAEQDHADTLVTARGLFEPLLQQLQISNRGDCYDPLPIAATQARLDPKMPGAVASVSNDGKVVAVATAEQVLAHTPTAPETVLLQYMASARLGRIGPGCAAPDQEPQVPEGMRELRFEYPDPAAPSAAPALSGDSITTAQG